MVEQTRSKSTELGSASRRPSLYMYIMRHLVVHLRDVVEEGKVLILHLDKVGDDLVEARFLADDVSDSLKSPLVLRGIHVHLIKGRLALVNVSIVCVNVLCRTLSTSCR